MIPAQARPSCYFVLKQDGTGLALKLRGDHVHIFKSGHVLLMTSGHTPTPVTDKFLIAVRAGF